MASHGLPGALRGSARPRWSHRDPVEPGNPFPSDTAAHARWAEATHAARAAMQRHDAALDHTTPTRDPARYRTRVIDLAAARFDVWAARGLVAVTDEAARRDYAAWLRDFAHNWLDYVAETCPHAGVDETRRLLRARLAARTAHWTDRAAHG